MAGDLKIDGSVVEALINIAPNILGGLIKTVVGGSVILDIASRASKGDYSRWSEAVDAAKAATKDSAKREEIEAENLKFYAINWQKFLEDENRVPNKAQEEIATQLGLRSEDTYKPGRRGLESGLLEEEGPAFSPVDFTDVANNNYTKYSEEQRQLMEKKWQQYYDELKKEFPLLGRAMLEDSAQMTGRPVPQTDKYARLADAFNAKLLYDPGTFQVSQGRTSANIGHGSWVANPVKLNTQDQKQMDKLRDLQGQMGQKRIDITDEWFRKKRDSKFEELSALLTQMQKEQFHTANSEMQKQLMDYQRWDENTKADFATFLQMSKAQLDSELSRKNASHQTALQQKLAQYQTMLQQKLHKFQKLTDLVDLPLTLGYLNRQLALSGDSSDIQMWVNLLGPLGRDPSFDEYATKLMNNVNLAQAIVKQGSPEAIMNVLRSAQKQSATMLMASAEAMLQALDNAQTAQGQQIRTMALNALQLAINSGESIVEWADSWLMPHIKPGNIH